MAITAQQVRDCFDEFSGATDVLIDKFIDQADRLVNDTQWGSRADDGRLYLTAHLLKLEKEGDSLAAGPITQKKVGDLSVGFGAGSERSSIGATAYGRHFEDLRSMIFVCRKV